MKLQQLFEGKEVEVKDGQIISKHKGIWDGDFSLISAGLTSLEGCPTTIINGWFHCNHNSLTSLKGCPIDIDNVFECSDNRLTSLEHGPKTVGKSYWCNNNKLTSIKGCPEKIGGVFNCDVNLLTSLEGCPSIIDDYFSCDDNKLTSLEGIHKHIKQMDGSFYALRNPIKSHVLGLFLIKGITRVYLENEEVTRIINDHLPKGRDGLISCQNALIEAGFEDFAQI